MAYYNGDIQTVFRRKFILGYREEESTDYDVELQMTYNRHNGSVYEIWSLFGGDIQKRLIKHGFNAAAMNNAFDEQTTKLEEMGYVQLPVRRSTFRE